MGTMLGSSPPARSAIGSDRAPAFPDALASASEQFGLAASGEYQMFPAYS